MITTRLSKQDMLPLTCSRTGTCCHGKQVLLNPWELRCLAKEKKMKAKEFRDHYCEWGGIRLRFDGKIGWKNQPACSQYIDQIGCSVHFGRPLSCRLYPLGRQLQREEAHYMYQGNEFPCLEGCPVVSQLPQLSVGDYLEGQLTEPFEKAQDAYLELMQQVADIAFELLLDTNLSESERKETLECWHAMGQASAEELVDRIGSEWMEALILPEIGEEGGDPLAFVQKHLALLIAKANKEFGSLQTPIEWQEASALLLGLALHLARGLGANPAELAELWIEAAKSHGAM
jgi:Fe-S-cluster containining protein